VFHVSIWGGLELCLEGLSPPKPPLGDGTDVDTCSQNPRRVMNAQHGRQIPRKLYFTSRVT